MLLRLTLNVPAVDKWELSLNEGVLYAYYLVLSTWAEEYNVADKTYYWACRYKVADDLPILFQDKKGETADQRKKRQGDTVYRINKRLSDKGLIQYAKQGSKDLVAIDRSFSKVWFKKDADEADLTFITQAEPTVKRRGARYPYTIEKYKDDLTPEDYRTFEKEKTGQFTDDITQILENLNEVANNFFDVIGKKSQKYRSLVYQRLKEGYTRDELIAINVEKTRQWYGTDREQFIRPTTLYAKKHINSYLNEARKQLSLKNGNENDHKGGKPVIDSADAHDLFANLTLRD